jgi:hypothetical protein
LYDIVGGALLEEQAQEAIVERLLRQSARSLMMTSSLETQKLPSVHAIDRQECACFASHNRSSERGHDHETKPEKGVPQQSHHRMALRELLIMV